MARKSSRSKRGFLNRLATSFFKGLITLVPIVGTLYLLWITVTTLDGLLGLPIPGLGLVIVLVTITLFGVIASNALGRHIFDFIETAMTSLPVVKLLYTSLKDLLSAFVGNKKTFDKPVIVDLSPEHKIKVLGFVTCTQFEDPKLFNYVAVYLPQSYNFAGNLIVVPRSRVEPIDADGSQFMAFIVSGGVTRLGGAETVVDTGSGGFRISASSPDWKRES